MRKELWRFLHHKRQRGCFPVPVGAYTAGKYAGDRKTKGL